MKIRRETVHEGTPAGTRNYTKASLSRSLGSAHTFTLYLGRHDTCWWFWSTAGRMTRHLHRARMVQHAKIRYNSKSHKCLEWSLGTNTVTGFCLLSYWFISSGHYIQVKMTKEKKHWTVKKKKKKSNFFDLHMLYLSFNSNPEAHWVRSLQRVEWLISNNLKYHFWQFNTVSQFMAPSVKNVGPVFFWKVVHGWRVFLSHTSHWLMTPLCFLLTSHRCVENVKIFTLKIFYIKNCF